MEILESVWQIGIIALVAGVLIGALAYRLFAPSVKQADKVKTELDEAREELTDYKASVNQHFEKTSELVQEMTQNYVKVYQHLAEGAQTLGDNKAFNNLLEQQPGRVSISVDDKSDVEDTAADESIAAGAASAETAGEPAATTETPDQRAEPSVGEAAAESAATPVKPDSSADKTDADKVTAGEAATEATAATKTNGGEAADEAAARTNGGEAAGEADAKTPDGDAATAGIPPEPDKKPDKGAYQGAG